MFRALVVLVMLVVVLPGAAAAQPSRVRLAWDPSADEDVAGYLIDYGTASGVYSESVDVGLRTEHAIPDLAGAWTYFFAVRAYYKDGVVSPRSTEVIYTAGIDPSKPEAVTELIWRHDQGGSVANWHMRGLNVASSGFLGSTPVEQAWRIVGTGDFNGDAKRDLIWQHASGWISVWLMNGQQLVSGRMLAPDRVADTDWHIAAVTDMDQDGKSDLVWQHHGNGLVAVWLMDGITRRDTRLLSPGQVADLDWKIVGAGDFNGDRSNDLLWRNRTTGVLVVWYMSGDRQLSGSVLSPTVNDLEWKVGTVADLSGDSKADIVWQHDDGRLGVWVIGSSGMVFGTSLNPAAVPDPRWHIVAGR